MTDPWSSQNNTQNSLKSEEGTDNIVQEEQQQTSLEFEDNFTPTESSTKSNKQIINTKVNNTSNSHQPLPDSVTYLQGLERKLQRIKKGAKLVDALVEKRQETLRSFLQDDVALNNSTNLELDIPVNNTDSAVQEICRQLQPVQAVTVGETVQLVHFDQLEQQRLEAEKLADETDTSR